MGTLEGLFICTEDELNSMEGMNLYFGEVLGKHSDVWIDNFSVKENCQLLSEDSEKIEWLLSLTGYSVSGFYPLEYFDVVDTYAYTQGQYDGGTNPYDPVTEIGDHARWNLGFANFEPDVYPGIEDIENES